MATLTVGVPLVVEMTRLSHVPMPKALFPIETPFCRRDKSVVACRRARFHPT
jgi:hypothetical protein